MPHYPPNTACAFTGHRPEKLPWRYNEKDPRCAALKARLYDVVRTAYESGIRHFICGMAQGCDMYFAEAVLALREETVGVTLEAAIPCDGQDRQWSQEQRRRYDYIVHQCDYEMLLQHDYSPDCMGNRNRYMVDRCDLLIAVCNGSPGGTTQTVQYARKMGVTVVELPMEA